MGIVLVLPAVLSFLALAAHFAHYKQGDWAMLVLPCLALPLFFFIRRRLALRFLQVILLIAVPVWLTAIPETMEHAHRPPVAAGILIGVAAFTLISAALLQTPPVLRRYPI